jgi:hypothetical protein
MEIGKQYFYNGGDEMSPLHPAKVELVGFKFDDEVAIITPVDQEDKDRLDRANGRQEQAVDTEYLEVLGANGELTPLQLATLTEEVIQDYSIFKAGDRVQVHGMTFMDLLSGIEDGGFGRVLVEDGGTLPEHENINPEGVGTLIENAIIVEMEDTGSLVAITGNKTATLAEEE